MIESEETLVAGLRNQKPLYPNRFRLPRNHPIDENEKRASSLSRRRSKFESRSSRQVLESLPRGGFPVSEKLFSKSEFTMSLTSCALRFVFALAASFGLSSLLFGSQPDLIGHWDGIMVREAAQLEVSFDFATSGTEPTGSFTSLTQQAMDYPLASVGVNADAIHFTLGDSLVFDGQLRGNEITGTFTDDGGKGDFTLRRTPRTLLPSLSREPCASLDHRGDTPPLYFCRAAVAKHAGAPIALSRIGSHAWGLLRWSTTNEGRVLPPEIGNPLPTMIWPMTPSRGLTSSLPGPISTPSELDFTDIVKVELLRPLLQLRHL